MATHRQPLLTLSPSQNSYTGSPVPSENVWQITPKMSRKESLDPVVRFLLNDFSELAVKEGLTDEGCLEKSKCNAGVDRKCNISIHVSPSSPSKQDRGCLDISENETEKQCLNINQLPFSPKLSESRSPMHLKPSYKHPTPTKSPLYTPNRKSIFLGRGSFGNVTLCEYKGSKFALKIVHPNSSTGEANLLGIRHPHLVEILHISKALNRIFICMEFAGHCNLQQILDSKSELDFPRRLSFCSQIMSGLNYCHKKGIVHGDIKPANVIVNPYGICKLGDFGHSIRNDVEEEPLSHEDDFIGTAAYAAPEILKGSRQTAKSDIYSFGILLWQVQTREVPFCGEHPHVVIYKVVHYAARPVFEESGSVFMRRYAELAKRCWGDSPSNRPNSSQVYAALKEIIQIMKELNE